MIDRELYLPAAWAADEERRPLTHVPDERESATKPRLAAGMLERARALGVHARWMAGDEVYGGREPRLAARRLGFDYTMAVKTDHRATTSAGTFTAAELAGRVPKNAWARMRTGHGLKGDRHYDWPCSTYPPTTPPPDTRPVTPTWSSAATATPANSPSTTAIPPPPSPWPHWST